MDRQPNRRTVLKQRSWIYKYPKTFQITFVTLGLSVFFSKQIYDIFFRTYEPFDFTEPPTTLQIKKEKPGLNSN